DALPIWRRPPGARHAGRGVAGQCRRPLPPRRRRARLGAARPQLLRRRPHADRRRRPLPLRHDQARRLPLGQPRQRLAAGPHPLLGVRPGLQRTAGDPDVLPRRPAVHLRPDLRQRPRGRPAPAGGPLRPRRHRARLGAGFPVGHRPRRPPADAARAAGAVTARPTPAQTAGPFLSLGLDWGLGPCVGDPAADGLLETWQADGDGRFAEPEERRAGGFRGFGRCLTDADGRWGIVTVKPSPLPASGGGVEAPHLDVALFARGLLDHLVTRIYFADEEAANESDPVLRSLPDGRARATLVAEAADGGYRFDIHLQGPDETLFFRL